MEDSEKRVKVSELLESEKALSESITMIESSYKQTSEEKALLKLLTVTTDKVIVDAVQSKLDSFESDSLTENQLIAVCLKHGFTLPEVVKNGLSKIRGGYMFRRKTLSKELTVEGTE